MADVANGSTVINLSGERQISVTSGRDVHLKIWAYRGSLGVSMTVEEATALWKGLCAAITDAIAQAGD